MREPFPAGFVQGAPESGEESAVKKLLSLTLAALLAAAPARPIFTAAEWGGAELAESENE